MLIGDNVKKIFKLFFFLFLIMIFTLKVDAASNEIQNININILIKENGDAEIQEIWDVVAASGTELYKPYYNLGNSKIVNFDVYENNQKFEKLNIWNIDDSRENKAYKSGINYLTDGLELCFGFGEFGKHIFTLKYTITNFVKQYNDADLIYFTLFPHNFTPTPKNVDISISSEKKFPDDTLIWGYGWEGIADHVDDKLIFNANNLNKSNYITILVKFPKGYYLTNDKINNNFEEVFKMAEKGVEYEKESLSDILFTIFIFSIFFITFFIIIKNSLKSQKNIPHVLNIKNRKLPKNQDIHYFRDIPCDKDLEYAYLVGGEYNIIDDKSNILSAMILKFIKEKKIEIIKKDKSNKIEFRLNACEKFNSESEKKLFTIMLNASDKNKVLTINSFILYAKKNYEKINSWFSSILSLQVKKLKMKKLVTEEISQVLKIKQEIPNETIREEAIKLAGLKKYFKKFTLIENKNIDQVKIWEEYLIFATLLGVAKKVNKKLKKLYPEFVEYIDYDIMDILFINSMSRSLVNISASQHRMNSGGSGFSSFGGGGGSFGGGAGGGGFR